MKIIFLAISYLIGSLSPSFFIVKWKRHQKIFNLGSGNAGAANVINILGLKWGILVGILDFLKGVIVVIFAQITGLSEAKYIFLFGEVFCICGHNWSIFLGFKGGTGLATSIGILTMHYPVYLLLSLIGGLIFNLFVAMELAVFLGGSIYVLIVIFLEKNLWAGILPLFLGIPIAVKRIYWRKRNLKRDDIEKIKLLSTF